MAGKSSGSGGSGGGVGIGGLLLLAFVVLKLCKVIDWSWWWVLSPAWIVLLLIVFGLSCLALAARLERKTARRRLGW